MSDRVGYRWTLILALVFLTGFIFIPFYGTLVYTCDLVTTYLFLVATTLTVFLVGELLQGISWGVFQVNKPPILWVTITVR